MATSESLKHLRELIRLKKLRAAVHQIEGPDASQVVNQGTQAINTLSQKIAEITEEMHGDTDFGKEVTYNEAQQRLFMIGRERVIWFHLLSDSCVPS